MILLTVLLLAPFAGAGVTGKIDSIGFGSFIRPDCWVPMVVQITSDEDGAKSFDLQVVQYDLDGDQVVYTRAITVNPGVQPFWALFKPEPINGGIPATGAQNAPDLSKRLRIFLADPVTGKRVAQIATAGNLPQALEFGSLAGTRGQKLMLVVGRSPNVGEYSPGSGRLIGTNEDALFVRVQPKTLPYDARGYESVDAVVWTDADIESPSFDAEQLRALRQYVLSGGRLVVCQNAETQRMGKLDPFLPVHVDKMDESKSLDPLSGILIAQGASLPLGDNGFPSNPFQRIRGPFAIARATALNDAIVDTWITWPDKTQTPYIARRLMGNGCVSWIAQDISEPTLTYESFGWPRVWERLVDWQNIDLALPPSIQLKSDQEGLAARFNGESYRDLGFSFTTGMSIKNTTAALISIAVIFFIGYWCVAGPGSFFVLAAKRWSQWSWFVFGAIAIAATALTMLVTGLVLRGGPQLAHISLVRVRSDGDEPAYVHARMGIYLPRDENAEVALTDHDDAASPLAITPLVLDPRYTTNEVSLRDTHYSIPVAAEDAPAFVSIPYRSTLKKLQVEWAGKPTGRVSGTATIRQNFDSPLTGQLQNNTGQDLKNVVMVFRLPASMVFRLPGGRQLVDTCLAIPEWKAGLTIDLADQWGKASRETTVDSNFRPCLGLANREKNGRGPWQYAVNWLAQDMRRGYSGDNRIDESNSSYQRVFPFVSLFDRCVPMTNDRKYDKNLEFENSRVELLRRGVRKWDCSAAVAGGGMVILGQADGPLPVPLTVDGVTPTIKPGDGHNFYQFVVPLDRSAFNGPPSTQPSEN